MKAMGLDIASLTGWSCIEDGKLIDYGSIQVNSQMDLPQRLHYFHLELTRVLNRINPDWCFIEDVILGISGAKTLAYLGRLNGVAINAAFSILQDRVKLFEPTLWKANSLPGLGGMAKKWQIQLEVIRHFNIPITGNFDEIDKTVLEQGKRITVYRERVQANRVALNKLKASIVRKRNPLSPEEVKIAKVNIKVTDAEIVELKKLQKDSEKAFEKLMQKTSVDISAQTGMGPDICDSCGVALCGIKGLGQ